MGKIKRFERRKPKLAQLVKFYIFLAFFGVMVLSLVPANRQLFTFPEKFQVGYLSYVLLSLNKRKAELNHFWNYEMGKEKQKYLYLLLEDLLSEMNYHQIYDVKEIQKVFGEVQKILGEELEKIKQDVEREVEKATGKKEYLEVKMQSEMDNVTMKARMLQKYGEKVVKKDEAEIARKSKKNELKSKLKAQIDSKYKTTQEQSTSKSQPMKSIPIKENPLQPISQSIPQQSQPITNPIYSSQPPTQLNLHHLFSNSICCSPSFQHNMLMYYVLILENVIRYETGLIKNQRFYEVYAKGVESFVFGNGVENLLEQVGKKLRKQNRIGNMLFNELNQQIEKEIQFVKILKGTVIAVSSTNTNQHQLIDPHKLLTYLINYRHLNKPTPINSLLIDYLKLISPKKNTDSSKLMRVVGVETEDRMVELAVNNKQFVNSLKQLYLEEKKNIDESDVKKKDKKEQKQKKKKKQNSLNCRFQQLSNQPSHKLIECIFQRIDNWHQHQNQQL